MPLQQLFQLLISQNYIFILCEFKTLIISFISLKLYRKQKVELYTAITIIVTFVIAHVFTFIEIFISFYGLSYSFISVFRTPISIVHRACLVVMNYLNFCLSRNVLFSLWFLKDSFVGYSNVRWQFFPLSTLNISVYYLWPSEFLVRNLLIIIEAFLYMMSCFLLAGL